MKNCWDETETGCIPGSSHESVNLNNGYRNHVCDQQKHEQTPQKQETAEAPPVEKKVFFLFHSSSTSGFLPGRIDLTCSFQRSRKTGIGQKASHRLQAEPGK